MNPENSELRGWILNILLRANPFGASFEVIETSLSDLGFFCSINELKGHLKYLMQKKYVNLEEIERGGVKRRINYITPRGIDLKEGNIEKDPGVMLLG